MDVNPDQMVALGKISAGSPFVKAFDWMNRLVLNHASSVIVMDKMMAALIAGKTSAERRIDVVRPWAADER